MFYSVALCVFIHRLLHKWLRVQLFSHTYRKFQMLWHKIFKLFSSLLLLFLVWNHLVIVSTNFLDWLPKDLNHFTYSVSFSLQLNLLILRLLLLPHFLLDKLLAAHPHVFLRVVDFLFVFTLEIFLHPLHLLEQEIHVGALCHRVIRLSIGFLREFGFLVTT